MTALFYYGIENLRLDPHERGRVRIHAYGWIIIICWPGALGESVGSLSAVPVRSDMGKRAYAHIRE
jgi:hypothetical protein